MRRIYVQSMLPHDSDTLWNLFSQIELYPQFVPFLKKAYKVEEIAVGSVWYDVTTVLWIPTKFKHFMTVLDKNKEVAFDVILPTGGQMTQRFLFSPQKKGTRVTGEITFSLGNIFYDMIIGPVLYRRLKKMLEGVGEKVIAAVPVKK